MIVFDNATPTGRNEGPVSTYPRRMGASLGASGIKSRMVEKATDKSRRYARLQDAKGSKRS